jgi:hypothetical protein
MRKSDCKYIDADKILNLWTFQANSHHTPGLESQAIPPFLGFLLLSNFFFLNKNGLSLMRLLNVIKIYIYFLNVK